MRSFKILVGLLLIVGTANGQESVRDCTVDFYISQIGVKEATGRNDGPEVEAYLATTGLGKGYAWCAALMNAGMEHCGIQGPRSAAWSPSWFPSSKTIYVRGRRELQTPRPGDIFGIYFPNKKRIAHVGTVLAWDDRRVTTIEGNTNVAGGREGDGVYKKWRPRNQIYKVANWIDR